MLIANHYPVTLLSKFAKNSFIKQEKLSNELHKRYAMIQLSSMSGVRYKVNIGVYSGTKNYILKLNDMINVLNKDSANLKTLSIDS
jgi:short-subunit dehydrogenase